MLDTHAPWREPGSCAHQLPEPCLCTQSPRFCERVVLALRTHEEKAAAVTCPLRSPGSGGAGGERSGPRVHRARSRAALLGPARARLNSARPHMSLLGVQSSVKQDATHTPPGGGAPGPWSPLSGMTHPKCTPWFPRRSRSSPGGAETGRQTRGRAGTAFHKDHSETRGQFQFGSEQSETRVSKRAACFHPHPTAEPPQLITLKMALLSPPSAAGKGSLCFCSPPSLGVPAGLLFSAGEERGGTWRKHTRRSFGGARSGVRLEALGAEGKQFSVGGRGSASASGSLGAPALSLIVSQGFANFESPTHSLLFLSYLELS